VERGGQPVLVTELWSLVHLGQGRCLRGLKENVTMGRLIPAGTGFEYYRHVQIPPDEPPPPQPSDDELALERDMEYFVEPEEALGPRIGEPDTGA
jgi:hypothetical protein